MRIDVWVDLVCPWCYLGKRRLDAALAGFEHRDEVEVVWHSFQLDPAAPSGETGETSLGHLAAKLGWPDEQVARMTEQMRGLAEAEGMTWNQSSSPHLNTGDAHRVLHLAAAEGADATGLMESLFDAHFASGGHIARPETLLDHAVAAGLPAERVTEVLAGQEFADAVAADQAQAAAYGATGVPFFVLAGKYGLSGAQPTDLLAQALDQVWAETQE